MNRRYTYSLLVIVTLLQVVPVRPSLAQGIDIEAAKTDSVDPVKTGENVTYVLSATNKGTSPAPDVQCVDVLPAGVVFQGFIGISQGAAIFIAGPNTVTANFGMVGPGTAATVQFVVKPNDGLESPPVLTISIPEALARDYHIRATAFSPAILGEGPTLQFILADDGTGAPDDACENLLVANAAALSGKIAIVRKSATCTIEVAAARAASAGAFGVLYVNDAASFNVTAGTVLSVNIPVFIIGKADGDEIIGALNTGPVNGNFSILEGQFLNTVRCTTTGIDVNGRNNVGLQYTSFLNDTDKDGIVDPADKCPNLAGAPQDDFDGDGLGDVCDPCTDADGDGFGNPGFPFNICPVDDCISDAGKSSPGICGCGVSDADDDKDGTVNCSELCPQDPQKTGPGVCGCGVADSDANGNGVIDCSVTAELRARINLALTSLAAAKVKNGKLNKKGKAGLAAFKAALADINSLLGTSLPAVQLGNPSANIAALNTALQNAGKKAQNFKSASFNKRKKGAAAALNKLLGVLAP